MNKCPKCGSKNIKFYTYLGAKVVKCSNCGYDESSIYDIFPEEKKSQKAKSEYNPYKTGGHRRTMKK